jgi:cation transporter-like permease
VALASIGVSAAFGLRYSIYGIVWRRLATAVHLGKVEPEHEYPPRFAQVLGSIALTLAVIAFLAGASTLGWLFTLAVAGLQSVLALTGYCLGCRLYFLRWWVPDLVTRIWTRGRVRRLSFDVDAIQYP